MPVSTSTCLTGGNGATPTNYAATESAADITPMNRFGTPSSLDISPPSTPSRSPAGTKRKRSPKKSKPTETSISASTGDTSPSTTVGEPSSSPTSTTRLESTRVQEARPGRNQGGGGGGGGGGGKSKSSYSEAVTETLLELQKSGLSYDAIAAGLRERHGLEKSAEAVRSMLYRLRIKSSAADWDDDVVKRLTVFVGEFGKKSKYRMLAEGFHATLENEEEKRRFSKKAIESKLKSLEDDGTLKV